MIGLGFGFGFDILGSNVNQPPVISDIIVANITDTGYRVTCQIDPMGNAVTPQLHTGTTRSVTLYTSSSEINEPTEVVFDVIGLLPYTNYYCKVVAGATELQYVPVITTLQPVELTDGNWATMLDYDYEKNVIVSGAVVELRDRRFDCALGDEILVAGDFESNPSGIWSFNTGWSISDGLLKGVAVPSSNRAFQNVGATNQVMYQIFRLVVTAQNQSGGTCAILIGGGGAYWNGVHGTNFTSGVNSRDYVGTGVNGYFYFVASGGNTNVELDNASLKVILGLHASQPITISARPLINTSIVFDGVNDYLTTPPQMTSVGTVYALAKRVGMDEDITILNTLTGIGQVTGNVLIIGADSALSTFYNINLKKLWVRTVTDSAGQISKLNEWFTRLSYELPEYQEPLSQFGPLRTGIWNDGATWNDYSIPRTI